MDRVVDDELRLQRDLACDGCGYNLRTLRHDGVCPECGRTVAQSLASDAERASTSLAALPVRWLTDRRNALTWMLVGLAVSIVGGLLVPLADGGRWRNDPLWETPERIVVLGVLCTGWTIGHLAGIKLLVGPPGGGWKFTQFTRGLLLVWSLGPAMIGLNFCWHRYGLLSSDGFAFLVLFLMACGAIGWCGVPRVLGAIAYRSKHTAWLVGVTFTSPVFALTACAMTLAVGSISSHHVVFNSLSMMQVLSVPWAPAMPLWWSTPALWLAAIPLSGLVVWTLTSFRRLLTDAIREARPSD